MPESSYLVQLTLPALARDGQRDRVFVAIGTPREDHTSEWSCSFVVEGLGQQSRGAMSGMDGLQALCLALSYVGQSLRTMINGGHRLLMPEDPAEPYDDDIDWPIDAYFGPRASNVA